MESQVSPSRVVLPETNEAMLRCFKFTMSGPPVDRTHFSSAMGSTAQDEMKAGDEASASRAARVERRTSAAGPMSGGFSFSISGPKMDCTHFEFASVVRPAKVDEQGHVRGTENPWKARWKKMMRVDAAERVNEKKTNRDAREARADDGWEEDVRRKEESAMVQYSTESVDWEIRAVQRAWITRLDKMVREVRAHRVLVQLGLNWAAWRAEEDVIRMAALERQNEADREALSKLSGMEKLRSRAEMRRVQKMAVNSSATEVLLEAQVEATGQAQYRKGAPDAAAKDEMGETPMRNGYADDAVYRAALKLLVSTAAKMRLASQMRSAMELRETCGTALRSLGMRGAVSQMVEYWVTSKGRKGTTGHQRGRIWEERMMCAGSAQAEETDWEEKMSCDGERHRAWEIGVEEKRQEREVALQLRLRPLPGEAMKHSGVSRAGAAQMAGSERTGVKVDWWEKYRESTEASLKRLHSAYMKGIVSEKALTEEMMQLAVICPERDQECMLWLERTVQERSAARVALNSLDSNLVRRASVMIIRRALMQFYVAAMLTRRSDKHRNEKTERRVSRSPEWPKKKVMRAMSVGGTRAEKAPSVGTALTEGTDGGEEAPSALWSSAAQQAAELGERRVSKGQRRSAAKESGKTERRGRRVSRKPRWPKKVVMSVMSGGVTGAERAPSALRKRVAERHGRSGAVWMRQRLRRSRDAREVWEHFVKTGGE
jgi:hypothetical protein